MPKKLVNFLLLIPSQALSNLKIENEEITNAREARKIFTISLAPESKPLTPDNKQNKIFCKKKKNRKGSCQNF